MGRVLYGVIISRVEGTLLQAAYLAFLSKASEALVYLGEQPCQLLLVLSLPLHRNANNFSFFVIVYLYFCFKCTAIYAYTRNV